MLWFFIYSWPVHSSYGPPPGCIPDFDNTCSRFVTHNSLSRVAVGRVLTVTPETFWWTREAGLPQRLWVPELLRDFTVQILKVCRNIVTTDMVACSSSGISSVEVALASNFLFSNFPSTLPSQCQSS